MFLAYISLDNVYCLLICIKITLSKVTKTYRDWEENLDAYIMMQFFYLISNIKACGHQKDQSMISYTFAGQTQIGSPAESPGETI